MGKPKSVVIDFIESKCYKVLSQDSNDKKISDMASLKVGVAKYVFKDMILPTSDCKELFDNVNHVMKIIIAHKKNIQSLQPSEKEKPKDNSLDKTVIANKSDYTLLETNNALEEEHVNYTLLSVFCLLESLDAAGRPLSDLYQSEKGTEQVQNWLQCLHVWGSYLPLDPTSNHDPEAARLRTIDKLNTIKNELRQMIVEHENITNKTIMQLIPKLQAIENILVTISTYIETHQPQKQGQKMNDSGSDDRQDPSWKKLGFLLPLQCGHDGLFSQEERHVFECHLLKAGFL